jgi:hypothetical protein
LRKENGGKWADEQWQACQRPLADGFTMDDVFHKITNMQRSQVMRPFYDFAAWPMANSQAQADLTIGTSNEITLMHRDSKTMISDYLSNLIVEATGQLIFGDSSAPSGPVQWLDHAIVARRLIASHAKSTPTGSTIQLETEASHLEMA